MMRILGPDSSFLCAASIGYLESYMKIHALGVRNKENEVADDIDYDAANILS